ncbi:MAG: alpha/beta fold hydrolase, partial [Gammaproteobacteria bacterium]
TRPPARDFPDDFYRRDARDMAELLDALELAPAVVLGWSEGAAVALWLAALRPARVSHVAIWGGISEVNDEDIAIFEARRDVAGWPARAREAMTTIYGDGYWQATWEGWCDVMLRLHAQGGDARLAPPDLIKCPVMILHGTRDTLIRTAHPRALHKRIPGAVLVELEEGGHNLHLSHATEFNQRVLSFLAG